MIPRILAPIIQARAQNTPVVAILGPRQSGKTTLSRSIFPNHLYVTLEKPNIKEFALADPEGFLNFYKNDHGLILDEIQNAPDLFSYIQGIVDENPIPGYFVLTGSQNFLLSEMISQTLAGRIALFTLLPLTQDELQASNYLAPNAITAIFKGSYPRIYDENVAPNEWLSDYIQTYVERDVRLMKNVGDLGIFQQFLKLCAGRIGQLVNLESLSNDCGISVPTVKSWLSILEASYIIFQLKPHHANFSKRLIKSPKIYFYDTGLACALLDIDSPEQLSNHYLRGGLFECYVISEIMKVYYNVGRRPHCYFWRDKTGNEVDCILEKGIALTPIEIKAGQTINSDFFKSLLYWNNLSNTLAKDNIVIYGGAESQDRSNGHVFGWNNFTSSIKGLI